jgi:hypothetical protein
LTNLIFGDQRPLKDVDLFGVAIAVRSAYGTKQTSRHVRSNAANGVEADIIGSL